MKLTVANIFNKTVNEPLRARTMLIMTYKKK